MASLDAARYTLAKQGAALADKALDAAAKLRGVLVKFEGLRLLDESCVGKNGVAGFAATRCVRKALPWN